MSSSRPRRARHGARYKYRRRAVDILFEAEARDYDPVAIVDERRVLAAQPNPIVGPISEYTAQIVNGVAVELDRIDEVAQAHLADQWSLERIPAVDRAVLRVACWELLFNEEVPPLASLVDAVEIASEYSTPVSAQFVNGVLDSIVAHVDELRAETQRLREELAARLAAEAEAAAQAAAEAEAAAQAQAEEAAEAEIATDATEHAGAEETRESEDSAENSQEPVEADTAVEEDVPSTESESSEAAESPESSEQSDAAVEVESPSESPAVELAAEAEEKAAAAESTPEGIADTQATQEEEIEQEKPKEEASTQPEA